MSKTVIVGEHGEVEFTINYERDTDVEILMRTDEGDFYDKIDNRKDLDALIEMLLYHREVLEAI